MYGSKSSVALFLPYTFEYRGRVRRICSGVLGVVVPHAPLEKVGRNGRDSMEDKVKVVVRAPYGGVSRDGYPASKGKVLYERKAHV